MGYLQDKEKEFREILATGDTEATVKWFMTEYLNSYRNGQKKVKSPKQEKAQVKN